MYIVLIYMLDFKNSIWPLVQIKTLSYDMQNKNFMQEFTQSNSIIHKNCIRIAVLQMMFMYNDGM